MTQHEFGGGWTQIKLGVLRDYLSAYTQALKNKPFKLLYVDAFAGSGECTPRGLDQPIDGSASIALDTPGFHSYLFIEAHKGRHKALKALCAQHPDKDIHLYRGDANKHLRELLGNFDSAHWRAVAFLDPYGMSVEWGTLEQIARTKAVDIWYLFSLSGLYRQAARDMRNVDESKARILDLTLGTTEWREAFYKESPQQDFFSDASVTREAGVNAMEEFVQQRLRTIFPTVLKPLRLPKTGAPYFSLFFAMANPDSKAVGLATRIADYILKKA